MYFYRYQFLSIVVLIEAIVVNVCIVEDVFFSSITDVDERRETYNKIKKRMIKYEGSLSET